MRTPIPKASSLGISQDNIIFGMVILAFIIYISMKGELKTYLGFFTPAAASSSTTSSAAPTPLAKALTPTTPGGTLPDATNQQGIFGGGLGSLPYVGGVFRWLGTPSTSSGGSSDTTTKGNSGGGNEGGAY